MRLLMWKTIEQAPRKTGIQLLIAWLLALALVFTAASAVATAQQPLPEDLSYGFFMIRADEQLEALPLAHTRWVRMAGVAAWGLVEAEPGSGVYDFSVTDPIVQEANDLNLHLLLTINQRHELDAGASQKALPTDMEAYKAFLGAFVERYDGDGFDDAPSSPVVRYWQIGNEPDNVTETGEKLQWNDTPENYALFLKESAVTIRDADPGATILIGGLAQGLRGLADFYEAVLTALDGYGGGPYFDVFDVHWFGLVADNSYIGLDSVVAEIRNSLTAHGYGDVPIWTTETATYSGTPDGYGAQSEEEQARDLAKRLLHFRSLGLEKVFWAPLREFHEWKGVPNGYFDNTGLVNNPLNDGDSSKKKAYFTHLLLASKLDGAVVQSGTPFMQLIDSSLLEGCEFTNYGNTYYAIWIDDPGLAGSPFSFPTDYQTFIVYTLVPDENNEIPSEVVQSVGGNFQYTIGMDPILVEYSGDGPSLTIVSPVQGMLTMVPGVDVSGLTDPVEDVLREGPYGVPPEAGTADGSGNFDFLDVPLAEGCNALTVIAGTGESTRNATVHVVLDTIPPDITVTYPVPNSSLNVPAIAVEGQVDLGQEVIFENPPSGLPLSVYGHEVSGGFVLPEETFPEGPNTVRLSAEDAAGNYSEILVDFLIDTQPPAITDVTVWVDTTDQTGPYAVQATVTDGDELLYAKLAYTLNGGSLVEVSMQPQGGNLWRGEIPGQPVGTSITYYAKARDLAGNIGTQPSAANPLKFRVVERQAPVITGVTALGDTDDTVNPYVVTANVSDNTVVRAVTLYYKIGAGSPLSVPMTDQGGGVYQGEIPPQPLNTLVGYWLKAEDVFNNFVMEPADFPSSFYWFRVVPDGSSNVIVEFTPVSTVISRGGNLEVDGSLYNLSPMRQSINFKTIVTTPNQNQKTLNNLNLSLAPLELKTKRLTYYIPPKAPLGTYTYSAIVSTVGGVELARDEFTFEVTD